MTETILVPLSRNICLIILVSSAATSTIAQGKKDSLEKASITKKAFREGMKFISTHPTDTIIGEKSTDAYLPYTGKIIRRIGIERVGFEKSLYDSAKEVEQAVTWLANTLHVDTRENIVRKHLFFRKNQPLNPYKLADNERYLRDRDFILDSRIVVTPIEGTDSVDLLVITRDVFSLGATIGGSIPNAPKIGVYDANVGGRAQRVEVITLFDADRTPNFGYSFLYRKSSLFGSLVDLDLGYTQINSGLSFGDETEFAWLVRLNRPLVSPYTRLAGSLELSRNESRNVFNKPDSTYLQYKYDIFNTWLGYNFGIHREVENRTRQFLAVRYFDGYYLDQPEQPEYAEKLKYNNIYGYLSEFTFYRQNFFKTRYVFGFGRTEDIPYGYTFGITGGYVRQLQQARPFAAVKLNSAFVTRRGNFYRILFESGGYYQNGSMEDIIINAGVNYFTKLWQYNRYKLRNTIGVTYTRLINHEVLDYLNLSKKEIPGFRSDSLNANSRLAFHLESVVYTPWSFLGFRMAPFAAVDLAVVNCVQCARSSESFTGYSAGLRSRNENLIFGTIEAKFTYIPQDEYGNSKFVFGFKQNIRTKNTGTFVKAPSLILYN